MSNKKGCYQAKKKNGEIYYRSSITYLQKHISLGSYASEALANAAYEEARRLLDDLRVQFSAQFCPHALPFDKYVALMNFRDNHYYFSTPIYAYARYFLYFYSRDIVFKFDTDDLFYFSSRRIMKRGGHYFVADYGMQVSLKSRYGIMPFAVAGRDYRFENGDELDYRYENITILSRCRGVRRTEKNGRVLYKAVIHIRSNYVIGAFETEKEAAIAYNKAADALTRNGFRRNFTQNYLEDVSPSEYAEIYGRIKLPKRIEELKPDH